jgi:hypothetical protein
LRFQDSVLSHFRLAVLTDNAALITHSNSRSRERLSLTLAQLSTVAITESADIACNEVNSQSLFAQKPDVSASTTLLDRLARPRSISESHIFARSGARGQRPSGL